VSSVPTRCPPVSPCSNSGTVSSHQIGEEQKTSVAGHVALETAIIENVSAVKQAASFTGEAQLRPLHINEMHANYRWTNNKLVVREFKAEATHLLSLRGNFIYTLRRNFRAREDVFIREDGAQAVSAQAL
jgi:hypothetical protein